MQTKVDILEPKKEEQKRRERNRKRTKGIDRKKERQRKKERKRKKEEKERRKREREYMYRILKPHTDTFARCKEEVVKHPRRHQDSLAILATEFQYSTMGGLFKVLIGDLKDERGR